MRFSQSFPVLMNLSLEALLSIIMAGKLCYNFCVWSNVSQMGNFPNHIPEYDYHIPVLLDIFLSPHLVFAPPLENFDYLVISFFHWLSLIVKWSSSSHYFWLFLCWLGWSLRNGPWEDIFKLGASNAAAKFGNWSNVGNDIFVFHC